MINFCLGTAQFGFKYGITNNVGKVSEKEVEKIMDFAFENNIKFFDTAQAYGESEKVLGKFLYKFNDPVLITKLSSNNKKFYTKNDIDYWEDSFNKSLKKLNSDKVNSFLIHDVNDLKKNGNEFLDFWLNSLLERKLVTRIGVSIYDASDLNKISFKKINLVQLPLSLYDQTMIKNGTIEKLKKSNIAIHARSIFFQGLLLTDVNYWPKSISKDLKNHHKSNFNPFNKNHVLKTLLNFINSCNFLESALIGVTSLSELKEIHNINLNLEIKETRDFKKFAWNNHYDLDPRSWN